MRKNLRRTSPPSIPFSLFRYPSATELYTWICLLLYRFKTVMSNFSSKIPCLAGFHIESGIEVRTSILERPSRQEAQADIITFGFVAGLARHRFPSRPKTSKFDSAGRQLASRSIITIQQLFGGKTML